MKRACSQLFLILLSLLLGSCSETLVERTQVLVLIDAGARVRQRADSLQVTFFSGKGDSRTYARTGQEQFELGAGFRWPARLALVPRGGDAERGFRIEVEARAGEQRLVATRVVSQFVAEKTLLLRIELLDTCIDFLSCGDTETCVEEQQMPACRDAKINPRTLPEIDRIPEPLDGDADIATETPADASDAANTAPDGAVQDGAPPVGDATADDAAVSVEAGTCGSAEDCFNGRDDDCDMQPDCLDPECSEVSRCVSDSEDTLGVVVRSPDRCPPGYGNPRPLYNNLIVPGCTGCSCGAISPAQCSINVASMCGAPSGSGLTLTSTNCPSATNLVSAGGFKTFAWNVQAGTCTASGNATPAALTWGETVYLCRPTQKGLGCDPGYACVPMPPSIEEPLCYKPAAGKGCAADDDLGERVWYSGYDDSRSCGQCTCEPTGAGCNNMRVTITSSCASAPLVELTSSQEYCSAPAASYRGYLTGTPTNGTCTPHADQNGRAAANGATVFCCRN